MNSANAYGQYRDLISGSICKWRNEATVLEKIGAAFLFAVLTALAAQVRIVLPFTPVPFTGQVLVVLVAAVVIGRFGTIGQFMYIGMGATFGWFTGMVGFAALTGITAGYLVGFLAASFFLGEVIERRKTLSSAKILLTMVVADLMILTLGSLYLGYLLQLDLVTAFAFGMVPFLIVDGMKVMMATSIGSMLIPRRI